MKFKLKSAEFDALPEDLKKEYKAAEGGYELIVEGGEDTGALKRAFDRSKEDVKTLTAQIADLEKNKIDLEKQIKQLPTTEEIAAIRAEADAKLKDRDNYISSTMIDAEAHKLASEISVAPSIMARVVKDRLTVQFDKDGKPALKIIGADGKPNDKLTMKELRQEIVDNKEYTAIIRGNLASGGAATRQGQSAGAANDANLPDPKTPASALSTPDLRARIDARKAAGNAGGAS